ncbi:histidine ammonia-lyase [Syntrophus gentianae]|uniref:Histidine ammonia-lyase n=1 Tax=Syntrophus gentianae TaxID=43775 RepID=A0A1H7VYT3_9BACT|nr:aromatic amino acid ammonia-lyase [Syntrophus gentianae]SEM13948.1 histidine ammonia-lyase [Syntrophus gentianae]
MAEMLKTGPLTVNGQNVNLDEIVALSRNAKKVFISEDRAFIARMEQSRKMLADAVERSIPVYGVTTGYGKSCGKRLSKKDALKRKGASPLPFHGCGTGEPIGIEETRAAMVCRLLCLARGYSGVSLPLLEQIASFLNKGITPVVPCEGSVGASGDLTPMSYIAATLAGDREVFYRGRRMPALEAIEKAKLTPYAFQMKEHLSMMNGTSVMTGIAVIAVERAVRILDAAVCAAALAVHALKGKAHHFHEEIGRAKSFPGQIRIARKMRELLATEADLSDLEENSPESLQDPYSIRCTPQIAGVLDDALQWISDWVTIEANSSNDNPIFDPESGAPLMSGNFYGGHMAFAMDALKAALASIADMSDRQVMLLVAPQYNRGLPADLVGMKGPESLFYHGFKAMSLSSSALAAEALKNTMPAGSFSRSTESHNQDKVSMGTIAARDAARICTLTERVVAIHLLAAAQACELRGNIRYRPRLERLLEKLRKESAMVTEDRPLDRDIEGIVQLIAYSDVFRI